MRFSKQLSEANEFIGEEELSNFTIFFTTEVGGEVNEVKFDKDDESAYNLFITLAEIDAKSVSIRNDLTGEGKLWTLK